MARAVFECDLYPACYPVAVGIRSAPQDFGCCGIGKDFCATRHSIAQEGLRHRIVTTIGAARVTIAAKCAAAVAAYGAKVLNKPPRRCSRIANVASGGIMLAPAFEQMRAIILALKLLHRIDAKRSADIVKGLFKQRPIKPGT